MYPVVLNNWTVLTFVDVDERPNVLALSYHASLPPSQTSCDEGGQLLGVRVLNAGINEFAGGQTKNRRG